MNAGLLFVFSDPGPAVSETEYNDWYDDEHVPLRIHIPSFHSWSRWVAVDEKRPGYFALYHMTSSDAVNEPPYSTLASTRSEREKDIIGRLAVLDRRTYDQVEVKIPPRAGDAYDVRRPGPFVTVVAMEIRPEEEDDLNRWYDEEHTEMLSKVPQWVRTTRWIYKDGGATGTDDSLKPQGGRAPKYLALHEWTAASAVETEEFKRAISTPWSVKTLQNALVVDIRLFKRMRTWDRLREANYAAVCEIISQLYNDVNATR